jgi:hypothetical protein
MEQGGKKKVNSIFEGKISFDTPRPKITSDLTLRETFVHQKYKDLLFFNPAALKAKKPISLTLKASSSDTRAIRDTKNTATASFSTEVDEQEQMREQMGYGDEPVASAAPPRRRQGRRMSIGAPDLAPKRLGRRMSIGAPDLAPKSMKNLNARVNTAEDFPQAPKSMRNISSRMKPSEDFPQAPKSMRNISSRMKPSEDFPQAPKSMRNLNARDSFDTFDSESHLTTAPADDKPRPRSRRDGLSHSSHGELGQDKRRTGRNASLSVSNHSAQSSAVDSYNRRRQDSLGASNHSADRDLYGYGDEEPEPVPKAAASRRRLGVPNQDDSDDRQRLGYGDEEPAGAPRPRRTARRSSIAGVREAPSQPSQTQEGNDPSSGPPRRARSGRRASMAGSGPIPVDKTSKRNMRGAALPESLQDLPTKGGSDETVATVSCDDSSDDEKSAKPKPPANANLLSSLYGGGEGAPTARPEASSSARRRTARRSSCV